MPDEVRDFTSTVAGTFQLVAEHSWPGRHHRPRVWEVRGGAGRRWFVKQHAEPSGHQREVNAYQQWTHLLGPGRAPEMVARHPASRSIIVTPMPGRNIHSHPLDARQEVEAYQQAGSLLARLHSAPVASTPGETEEEWRTGVEQMLNDAALYLPSDATALLRDLTRERPATLPALVAHADFQPRNWLWHEATRTLHLIDFERTCIEPPVRRDLARLELRILPARPRLRPAFYDGYGRQPSPAELHACCAYGALDAVSLIKWGLQHHDVDAVNQAHAMLANLRIAHTHLTRTTRRAGMAPTRRSELT
ncbi:aminoglycoside phosphotransferase family protein [Streptomyces sp. NPDC059991]|uniref:aminoglycoside phosphotransferase family protein n=1 Tax=Streptomyces sp. NPDC059991 TaxID=3347028 RepID=UPI00369690CD